MFLITYRDGSLGLVPVLLADAPEIVEQRKLVEVSDDEAADFNDIVLCDGRLYVRTQS